jgi:hypothetical protein
MRETILFIHPSTFVSAVIFSFTGLSERLRSRRTQARAAEVAEAEAAEAVAEAAAEDADKGVPFVAPFLLFRGIFLR